MSICDQLRRSVSTADTRQAFALGAVLGGLTVGLILAALIVAAFTH